MKLTKVNIILLILGLLLLFFQGIAATSACPAGLALCYGPRGVNFLGLNLDISYIWI